MKDFSMYIPKVRFERISIKDLTADQNYQRKLSAPYMKRPGDDVNAYLLNPIKVNRRN